MTTLNILIDKATTMCTPPNGAELGRRLGLTRSSVSVWKQGGAIKEKHLTALIELAHADPSVAIQVMREQATTAAERHVWGALARQLGVAATLAAVTLLAVPSGVYATGNAYYVKWRARLFLVRSRPTYGLPLAA